MEYSYNGWPASNTLKTRVITPVKGVSLRVVDNNNVADVFSYLVINYHRRVAPIVGPVLDDWGYNYRANVNDPSQLSCHASGTAIDVDSIQHPNSVPTASTFTLAQINEIHKILIELENVIRWGGDYHHTVDAMHFEVIVPPGSLHKIGAKIRKLEKKRGKYGFQLVV